jgi:hypothetical protein
MSKKIKLGPYPSAKYMDDSLAEFRRITDSRSDEWIRKERAKREAASKKRHDNNTTIQGG